MVLTAWIKQAIALRRGRSCSRGCASSRGRGASKGRTGDDGNGGVDIVHESIDTGTGVVVNSRYRSLDGKLKSVNHGTWDICQGERGDKTKLTPGIVWYETVHGNLVLFQPQTIGDTLRKECKDLG